MHYLIGIEDIALDDFQAFAGKMDLLLRADIPRHPVTSFQCDFPTGIFRWRLSRREQTSS
jgi:hypothetical protein